MARKPKSGPPRVVTYTVRANRDRREIYLHNCNTWGRDQAIAYRRFLVAIIREYAKGPASAPVVEGSEHVRMGLVRWPGARDGHRVIFQETENGILVLRILHTKMNWQDHLDG